jgi:HK97 family phage major capsid protein
MTPSNRSALLAEADSLLHKPSFSKEDSARVESLLRLAETMVDKTELRAAKSAQREIELGREPYRAAGPDERFLAYLRKGSDVLTQEERNRIGSERSRPQLSAYLSEGTGSAGGYLVPQPFADRFESMLQQYDQLFSIAKIFSTSTGAPTGYPILDDVSNEAAIVAENAASSQVPTPFAKLAFAQCPTWRSGQVIASVELAQDSNFDLTGLAAGAFSTRFARGIGAYMVGLLLEAAALGVTAASATAIAGDEIYELIDSLNAAYITNASFLMTHATYTSLLRLKGSGSGDYLFHPTFDGAGRPTLCSFPVFFSPSMPAMTAGLQSVAFGDLSRFLRREVAGSLQVKTYRELFAASGSIAWEAFWRVDGGLLLSGSQVPVNFLVQHA